ncbi:MAG: cyanophycin synthetase, partial [Arcobacteraceae bacterium]
GSIKLYPSKDIHNIEFILKDDEPYTKFTLKDFGEFEVWGFGVHIALDASCAILAASQTMSIEQIKENLQKYKGIKKRFDIVQKSESLIVIDDYAHHPTEIKATLESVKLYNNYKQLDKKIVIWQPHKYSRTMDNLEAFKKCFQGCDELIILPVWTVAEEIKEINFEKEFAHYNTTFCTKIATTNGKIELYDENGKPFRTISDGLIIGVGAGDITYQLRH